MGSGTTPPSTTTPGATPPSTANPTTPGPSAAAPSAVCSSGNPIYATPANYKEKLAALKPGDRLVLAEGVYQDSPPGLPIFGLNGTAAQPIVITGPASGRALLIGTSTHNTIRFDDASYVAVCNIEIDGKDQGGFGVAVQGPAHHITLDGLTIRGVGGDQQVVGISTTGFPTWNWTIRRNTIIGAGTGMYLGNSDGSSAFVAGLIEHNLVRDTIGYNTQVKYQTSRAGIPSTIGPAVTIIRHNVFSKSGNSSTGGEARPNLLVDRFPLSGAGATDRYEIYGNFFWQNPSEALFQGNGNVAFHDNVLVNDSGSAVVIQPHDGGNPRQVAVYANTIVASGTGISLYGGDAGYSRVVTGNAVFAGVPISSSGCDVRNNITGSRASASAALNAPFGVPGSTLDLYPKVGALRGATAFDLAGFTSYADYNRDFNGTIRDGFVRGAYAGEGVNPGWALALALKP
ncbi:MAG TPA: hypothetical protein VFS42_07080 [Burkholderiaceae bacterium]|nr:hypothetical protein [Burkholderiaceae bacterium]